MRTIFLGTPIATEAGTPMSRTRSLATALVLLSFTTLTRPATAQVISDLQIAPVNITMTVGESRTFLATAYDTRGNPLITSNIRWISTNQSVVRVTFDPATPNVVTVEAVGAGVASIEASVGGVRSQTVIRVQGDGLGPITTEPTGLPSDIMASASSHVVRLDPEIFGVTASCRVGAFVEPDLVATSYSAIRGATGLRITLADGRTISDVSVAAYDLQTDVALLRVNANHSQKLNRDGDPSANQQIWLLAQPDCNTTQSESIPISGRSGSFVTLGRDLGESYRGAPLVNSSGTMVAIAAAGSAGVPASQLGRLVAVARANVTAGQLQGLEAVARRENHAYGSLALQSQTFGASARVSPLEDWQWPELNRNARLPFTYTGPMGRYTIALMSGADVLSTVTAEIRPGTTNRIVLAPPVVAEEPEAQPPATQLGQPRGGGFPIPLAIAGGVGAAGVVALLLLGGDGPTDDTGSITITFPSALRMLLMRRDR
jgi:hypothetical protein